MARPCYHLMFGSGNHIVTAWGLATIPRHRACPFDRTPGYQSLSSGNTGSSGRILGNTASGSLMSDLQCCFPPLKVQNSLKGQVTPRGWTCVANDDQRLGKQKGKTPHGVRHSCRSLQTRILCTEAGNHNYALGDGRGRQKMGFPASMPSLLTS